MLGGSFWVALLRNGMGAVLMMTVFLLLDRPRYAMKRTVLCYAAVGFLLAVLFSVWYLADRDGYIRFSGPASFLPIGFFCGKMSSEGIYLSLYKMTLCFYFLALSVFCGVDMARWWFDGNIWSDLAIRFVLDTVILCFIALKFRKTFLENVDYLRKEMDLFSAFILVGSVLMAALVAYWPPVHTFSVLNIVRIFIIMAMAGIMQYLIFYLYIYLGKRHACQEEMLLLAMNEQFLRRQLELEKQAEEEALRMRHDIRYHCGLIEDYIKKGETEALLSYVKQYGEETETHRIEHFCRNRAVNSILSVYCRYAREERIQVTADVAIAKRPAVRDIDLAAILANIFETAIYECLCSKCADREIAFRMSQKGHKIVIQCRSTCSSEMHFRKSSGKSLTEGRLGLSSIEKTASRYDGETDFTVENGMLVTRVLLNLPRRDRN